MLNFDNVFYILFCNIIWELLFFGEKGWDLCRKKKFYSKYFVGKIVFMMY